MKKHIHILVYSDDPGLGGSARYDHSILCSLAEAGYQVTYVNSEISNPMVERQKELGVKHVWLEFDTVKEFGRTLSDRGDAHRIFSMAQPDLVLFSDACPLSNFAAKQVAIQLGIPYITTVGFAAPYLAERFADYLDELSHHYEIAKSVLAIAHETLNLLKELFRLPKHKGQVIYWGREAHYFEPINEAVRKSLRQEFNIPENAIVCFTAARLIPVKGYEYQIEAIKQLAQTSVWPRLYFVWAGSGPLESQIREDVKQLGVDNQVKILGQRWDIKDWLDASDIFILPSLLDSLGLAIIEAMAKGLPVIASAVGGIPEVLSETGKLLPDPNIEPQATIRELVKTILAWSENPEIRHSIGQAGKRRADKMFREEKMVKDTVEVIERALLPVGDYVSPGLSIVLPDKCFPNKILGDPRACPWPYQRQGIPHNWYVDKRWPDVGFLNRDEAHILYNTALKFKGKKALEIGCFMGWSACHLALGGVELDVIDPLLGRQDFYESVNYSLTAAGVRGSVNLVAGFSPQKVEELATQFQRRWSLIFIDGEHAAPGPLNDAIVCENFAEADAIILFHDLPSPEVTQGLDYLRRNGWNTMVYQTLQIMGVAWRGNVEPVKHQPDPKVQWLLPEHLQQYSVSGLSSKFITGLTSCVEQYQRNSSDWSALAELRKVRKSLAELWLGTAEILLESVYLSEIGKGHQLLLKSGLINEPLTDDERAWLDELVGKNYQEVKNQKAIQSLLATMLYRRADQLPMQKDLLDLPLWFLNDYLRFALSAPRYFWEVGEADNYYQYMQGLVNYLLGHISDNPNSSFWHDVALGFLENASFLQVYFNEANLKEIYVKRAEILESFLRTRGHEIDWEFPAYSPNIRKIRIGILASHFIPAAETFASLPIYEYISRDFEVILYSLSLTGHPLEQYCQSCANSYRLLPANLTDQVDLIRGDDLDILFIATNVTIDTNPICLLALHKLARIQVTSVGAVVTTGMRNIDYYISGKLTEPTEDAQKHYQEKLLKIEGAAHCFSYGSEINTGQIIEVKRESLGLSKEKVVFISGANAFKITPELRHTWAKILAAVPNSVLVLYPWGPNWSDNYPKQSLRRSFNEIFAQYGVQPDQLIILDPEPIPNRDDIKEYLKLADIYLDSYPFSGTTSIIDPLEVGIPVITRQGNYFRGAMGAALLLELGMPDLVVNSEESYIQLASSLGIDSELRHKKSQLIKQKMQKKPRFLDSRAYSAQVETLFRELIRTYWVDALSNELRLRDINLIIFPDWKQPEESLLQDLTSVIREIVTHPDRSRINLLVDTSNVSDEEADLAVSSVVMNLLMEEDLDVSEGAEISLIGERSEIQWETILRLIHTRIIFEGENQQAIIQAKAESISSCELKTLSDKRAVQLDTGTWELR